MTSEDASKLFVAGLPESIDESVLQSLFEATGATVVNVSLPKDRMTGRARGFGFVTLGSAEQAEQARQALDGSLQSGRAISVRPFQGAEGLRRPDRTTERREAPRSPADATGGGDKTLYVGNLPYDTGAQEVEAVLAEVGVEGIVRTHLPVQPDGRLRGFGFVTMASPEAAQAAVDLLRSTEVRGRRLTVNIAHPRGAPGGAPGVSGGGPMVADRGPRRLRPGSDASGDDARPPRPDSLLADSGGAFEPSARPVEGRRARPAEGKKKKKKEKEKAAAEPSRRVRDRGGAGSWQRWTDWDDD